AAGKLGLRPLLDCGTVVAGSKRGQTGMRRRHPRRRHSPAGYSPSAGCCRPDAFLRAGSTPGSDWGTVFSPRCLAAGSMGCVQPAVWVALRGCGLGGMLGPPGPLGSVLGNRDSPLGALVAGQLGLGLEPQATFAAHRLAIVLHRVADLALRLPPFSTCVVGQRV